MKTRLCFLIFCCLGLLPRAVQALDAGVSFAVYATPEKPYVEINLEIAAKTILFKPVDSTHIQAGVEVLILILQGDKVVNYEKYILNSPVVQTPQSLLDVKRLSLANGDYDLEIRFQDLNTPDNKDVFKSPLKVAVGAQLYLSELQLLRGFRKDESESPFTKNGYYLEPLPFNFYDRNAISLAFYAEMYHTASVVKSENYLVRYFIEREKGNDITELISVGSQRKRPTEIDALLVQMDISKLESGNYSLTVELRNHVNELLSLRKLTFQRSNPFLQVKENELTPELMEQQFVQALDKEVLVYSLKAIMPLVGGADEAESLKNILKAEDLKEMRFFLFRFFARRDPNNPEIAYRRYIETANAVDKQFFSGFRRGFETDRGRTFLRYGRPDDLVHVEDDPDAPPYEIWVYYNFPKTNQKNVKFLFYNPSLAGEDYVILHSTARGEINNPRWERVLYSRNGEQYQGNNYHDATEMQRNVNRNARMYFEDF